MTLMFSPDFDAVEFKEPSLSNFEIEPGFFYDDIETIDDCTRAIRILEGKLININDQLRDPVDRPDYSSWLFRAHRARRFTKKNISACRRREAEFLHEIKMEKHAATLAQAAELAEKKLAAKAENARAYAAALAENSARKAARIAQANDRQRRLIAHFKRAVKEAVGEERYLDLIRGAEAAAEAEMAVENVQS